MFIDVLRSRRSIRQFTDKPVEADIVDRLMEAVLRSPAKSIPEIDFNGSYNLLRYAAVQL